MKTVTQLVIMVLCGLSLNAQNLPSKSEILADLLRVNTYYMDAFPETETVSTGEPNWLEGSYFNGHLALFELYPSTKNISYAKQWGTHNDWSIGNKPHEADNQCVGQAYMEMYYGYGAKDDYMLEKVGSSVSALVNRSAVNEWDWIDALYMAMPVLTRYGIYNDDARYFDKLYKMYNSTKVSQRLYNSSTGLWYRDGKVLQGKKCGCYWSRGNGWVFGAHVRTLMYLPEDDPHRKEYIETFRKMAEKLKSVQRTDGFWNVSLTNPSYYGGPETSGTGFFVYGIAWGINSGLLDKDAYLPVVIKGWNGLSTIALQANGRIGYAQGVADEPKDAQPVTASSSRNYGEGNFLLAGTEVIKLAEGEMPVPDEFFVKKVEMLTPATLKIYFFEPAEKSSVETISNYKINNGVVVESAVLSQDGMSCELSISNIKQGAYGISFNSIKSKSGKTIAMANGKYFFVEESATSLATHHKSEVVMQIYPNPVDQKHIRISLNMPVKSKVQVQIFDLSGKLIVSKSDLEFIDHHIQDMNLENLSKGAYVLNLKGDGILFNEKLMVN